MPRGPEDRACDFSRRFSKDPTTEITDVNEAIQVMADEVEQLFGLDATEDQQRAVVAQLLKRDSFEAWFCVACELGERKNARRQTVTA